MPDAVSDTHSAPTGKRRLQMLPALRMRLGRSHEGGAGAAPEKRACVDTRRSTRLWSLGGSSARWARADRRQAPACHATSMADRKHFRRLAGAAWGLSWFAESAPESGACSFLIAHECV